MKRSGEVDPFEVIGRIPKGRVYQWVAEAVLGDPEIARRHLTRMTAAGWKPVPWQRHRKMTRIGRRIVVDDQVLMENSADAVAAARNRELADARAMVSENAAGKYSANPLGYSLAERWEGFPVTSGDMPASDGQPRIVDVTLNIKLSPNLVDSAAVCALPVEEYARRLMALLLRGDLKGILEGFITLTKHTPKRRSSTASPHGDAGAPKRKSGHAVQIGDLIALKLGRRRLSARVTLASGVRQ